MHRAVAARLASPEISLFEALRIGGFEYPADEDASVVDIEKVTLGQRKNQLSRRLRLAKKQQSGKDSAALAPAEVDARARFARDVRRVRGAVGVGIGASSG